MEPNDTQQLPQFSSYFHPPTAAAAATTGPSTTNGLLPPHHHHHHHHHNNNEGGSNGGIVYPHSVASSGVMSTLEPVKRKRGRPRKYGTPEQALAAKKTAAYSNSKENRKQREQQQLGSGGSGSSYTGASKKPQIGGFGNLGQGFIPHVISVAAGEDVGQKIMLFRQQRKHEICILSASGSVTNASLRQPATTGGNITYEGRFEIVSLSGSYVRTEFGGRTGGLSVCLSSTDGQIVGGGVGGPLKAAGPVQVIVGTFQIDSKKDVNAGLKGDCSGSKLASPVAGASVSSVGFCSPVESYGRNPVGGNDDLQTIGGTQFMIQPGVTHASATQATEWRGILDARSYAVYDLTGRTDRGGNQSPENGDYGHIAD